MLGTKEEIKDRLRQKYCGLEKSGIGRHTFYQWDKNGLPKNVIKFFEIAKKAEIDPRDLFEIFVKKENQK